MDWILILKGIIIAIVEGITEFLPISSTGHMILVGNAIGFTGGFANLFEIVIQLGAILAVVVLYKDKIINTASGVFKREKESIHFTTMIIVAFIPSALLGFYFDDAIESLLFNPLTVAIALIVGAIMMLILEWGCSKSAKTKTIEKVILKQAIIIGVFQCLALWPGMSRSASTIMGAWIAGLSTVAAAEFSFFLAIPTMIGATAYKLISTSVILSTNEIITLIIGFIVAFLTAYIVVEKFIGYLKKHPLKNFAIYRMVVGIIILAIIFF